MLFNSIEFLIFFPVVTVVYFALPQKCRKLFLFAASCYFYMSFIPGYIIILAVDALADYFGALLIERYSGDKRLKKLFLILPIAINVGMLVYFKYMYFFTDIINFFGIKIGFKAIVLPEIILPLGISFLTFQSIGYLIDVYRGKVKCQKNILTFAVFLMFFPQLVAGPIERAANLMGQFDERRRLTYTNLSQGGRMMLWGMLKKVLIADNLAKYVNAVYGSPGEYSREAIYIAVIFFAAQIYCDFSGYSDIAIGSAKIMGFRLMKNFDTPYFSPSMTVFWRRWHISLSTWFKDYVYIPLGGNRVSRPRWCLNQMITFSISGLWHGANFTFVIWGILHGLAVILEKLSSGVREKISGFIRLGKLNFIKTFACVCYAFAVTCISWVFFRAETFSDAFYILKQLFSGLPSFESSSIEKAAAMFEDIPRQSLYASVFGVALLFAVDLLCRKSDFGTAMDKTPFFLRIPIYALFIFLILTFGAYETRSFIYFQF